MNSLDPSLLRALARSIYAAGTAESSDDELDVYMDAHDALLDLADLLDDDD